MRTTALLTCALLALSACGDTGDNNPDPDPNPDTGTREAGFGPDDKALVWIESASYTTDSCSDWSEWTSGIDAFNAGLSNVYTAFGGNAEGTVDLLRCSSPGQLATCTPRTPPARYEVNGFEYSRTLEDVVPLEDIDCTMTMRYDIVLTDAGNSIIERMVRTHELIGSDCAAYESYFFDESPNGQGISDCVITFTSQMEVRDWSPR